MELFKLDTLSNTLMESLAIETMTVKNRPTLSHVSFSKEMKNRLTAELLSKGYPLFSYALCFNWEKHQKQAIHIDGNSDDNFRISSLNIVISGGENCRFQWFDSPGYIKSFSTNNIASFKCNEEESICIEDVPLHKCMLVRTNVPHRVNIKSDTVLLCLRFLNNPDLLK